MTFAAVLLLLLTFGLVFYDWVDQRGQNRRALWVEVSALLVGAFFIAFPNRATELAHFVGIGRGVDFLLYPIVIWLVRESLRTRRLRQRDEERMTELVRLVAVLTAETRSHGLVTGSGPPLPPSGSGAPGGTDPHTAR